VVFPAPVIIKMSSKSDQTKKVTLNARIKQGDIPQIDSMADVIDAMGNENLSLDVPYALFTTVRVWICVLLSVYLTSISPWSRLRASIFFSLSFT